MQYQVIVWTREGWTKFGEATDDPEDARWLSGLAVTSAADKPVRVLAASTFRELDQLCDQWMRTGVYGRTGPALRSAEDWHAQMDAVELGQGGDHDAAYQYQPPDHAELAAAWVHLAARVVRGDLGGMGDGSNGSDGTQAMSRAVTGSGAASGVPAT